MTPIDINLATVPSPVPLWGGRDRHFLKMAATIAPQLVIKHHTLAQIYILPVKNSLLRYNSGSALGGWGGGGGGHGSHL